MFFHFEIRNAVAHQTTGLAVLFEEVNIMASPGQLLGSRKSCWTAANNSHFLAGFFRGDQWLDPAIFPGLVNDGAFNRLDGDGRIFKIEGA